ncbi:lipocalin family protein [Sorangium sp. So ce726]|uniref:lipocalin family protein n=1 Tax=Sorangium sp. So ce726 TaxID=3133319 RepID=UPI003F5F77A6
MKPRSLVALASLAVASPAFAQLADQGVPAMVDPAVDLAAHTPGPEMGWADSIYFTSRVKAGGHDIGLLVHTLTIPQGPGQRILFSVTDETTGWYKNYVTTIDPSDYHWSTTKLDIRAPGLEWTGDAQKMSVSLTVPWGSLDIELKPRGPALSYGGAGMFRLFGEPNYEFAFPNMRTTGTLTVEGRSMPIVGHSWLDRQWGPVMPPPNSRWLWMSFNLPNGDALALWDTISDTGNNSWATLVHADGSHEVVAVEPVANDASELWTSPSSGQEYPTRWCISIPALRTNLTVRITGTVEQELVINGIGRLEATAAFTGTYRGARVTGKSYVEMFGDWQD